MICRARSVRLGRPRRPKIAQIRFPVFGPREILLSQVWQRLRPKTWKSKSRESFQSQFRRPGPDPKRYLLTFLKQKRCQSKGGKEKRLGSLSFPCSPPVDPDEERVGSQALAVQIRTCRCRKMNTSKAFVRFLIQPFQGHPDGVVALFLSSCFRKGGMVPYLPSAPPLSHGEGQRKIPKKEGIDPRECGRGQCLLRRP